MSDYQQNLETAAHQKAASVLSLYDLLGPTSEVMIDEARSEAAQAVLNAYNEGILHRNEAYFKLVDIYLSQYCH